jgi:hypothetical protein
MACPDREDALTAALASGLGPVPLFGGSAADGTRFLETFVLHGGQVAAQCRGAGAGPHPLPGHGVQVRPFPPTETRMVVTGADPARRIVRRINAEPAAQEYARLLGKDPAQLTPSPLPRIRWWCASAGSTTSARSGRSHENGDLIFYSAIDEGLVLTLAEPQDMVAHLDGGAGRAVAGRRPRSWPATACCAGWRRRKSS